MAFYGTVQDYLDAFSDHGFTDESQSRQIEVLNDAYYDVCSRMPWAFLEKQATVNTQAGVNTFNSQPTDIRAILSMIIDTAPTVQIIQPIRLDDQQKRFAGAQTNSGTPYYYYFVGDTIQFYPIPDAAYPVKVSYLAWPVPLALTTDVPVIPQRHRRVLLLGALASLYDMEDDTDLSVRFEGRFEARIQRMQEDLSMKQYDRPDTIADLFRFDDIWE